ncbi:MAG: chromosome partitioning protein [Sphingomonas sp.]|jgi:exopolysaccharide/PEP-CTERM locus tyrosine autokinase|nr:MAG: chromosome partitioning protein [Sphingomonas sp.]
MTVTTPKTTREPSLLERAAKVYDFNAHARARDLPETDPVRERAVAAPANTDPTFLAIPEELRAAVGEELPDDFHLPLGESDIAAIDRGMLAANGMIVPGAPVGPLAEEFRLIKRQLLITQGRIAESDAPDKARTILVCSARPEDGKTFCAVNLALSLAAERDTEVLLVDADVAKPDVLNQLGIETSPGLLDALADSHIDVETLVVRTDVPHLSVLPAGTRTAMDTELLASARTRSVLARLLAANPRRVIIFDSPPALAASPASVLAMLVGQVMLVVRADRTPEGELRAAVNLLDSCEHIQLVLNAVSFVPGGARFGSYYGQGESR